MALIFRDTFTGASAELSTTVPDTGTGWSQIINISATARRNGSGVFAANTGGLSDGCFYTANTTYDTADYSVKANIAGTVETGDDPYWLGVRVQDANNGYFLRFVSGSQRMYKRVGGTWTALGTLLTGALSSGDVIELEISGTTLRWLLNGTQMQAVTDSSISAAGKGGIGMGSIGAVTGDDMDAQQLDNFEVNTLTNITTVTKQHTFDTATKKTRIAQFTFSTALRKWYDTQWNHRKNITVYASKVGAAVTDFPVYLPLSLLGADFFAAVRSDGGDIRITKADGITEVPVEVVRINTGSQTGELHFRADALSNTVDTQFCIYYGNASATMPAANSLYGSQNVWSNNYAGVYHLDATTYDWMSDSYRVADSTSNNRFGTLYGGLSSVSAQKIGNGLALDGVDDEVLVSGKMGNPAAATLQGWGYKTVDSGQGEFISVADAIAIRWNAPGIEGFYDTGSGWPGIGNGTNWNLGWHMVHYTVQPNDQKLYVDGVQRVAGTDSRSIAYTGGNVNTMFGVHGSGSGYQFPGNLDEIRVSSTVRSGGWISTEYNNQNDPATFFATGTQEDSPVNAVIAQHTFQTVTKKTRTPQHSFSIVTRKPQLKSHTFQTTVRKATVRQHSFDTLLKKPRIASHTFQTVTKKFGRQISHTLQTVTKKARILQHTFSAVTRRATQIAHSFDVTTLKRRVASHSFDTLLKRSVALQHTFQTVTRAQRVLQHSFNVVTRKAATLQHSFDTALRKPTIKQHTFDAATQKPRIASHTFDVATKVHDRQTTHTFDVYKLKTRIRSHTFDVVTQSAALLTHTFDILLRTTAVLQFGFDTYLQRTGNLQHSFDLVTEKPRIAFHTFDAALKRANVVSHGFDTVTKRQNIIQHSFDTLLEKQGILQHSFDTHMRRHPVLQHSFDISLKKAAIISHTFDTLLQLRTVIHHNFDTILKKGRVASHTFDTVLQETHTAQHGFDVVTRKQRELSHSFDSSMRKPRLMDHSFDIFTKKVRIATHSFDIMLQRGGSLQHTFDVETKHVTYIITKHHTFDVYLKQVFRGARFAPVTMTLKDRFPRAHMRTSDRFATRIQSLQDFPAQTVLVTDRLPHRTMLASDRFPAQTMLF